MKPILFNTDMVRAILAGRKTVTRRVVKPQPENGVEIHLDERGHWRDYRAEPYLEPCHPAFGSGFWCKKARKPPYRPGDILYVRETWCKCCLKENYRTGHSDYCYKSSIESPVYGCIDCYTERASCKWRPSIHMPKEAARLFLRVTDVRVERLRGMTCSDMVKEGIIPKTVTGGQWEQWQRDYMKPVWDSTIKSADRAIYGWDSNPYVFVIEFCRISKEEAQKTFDKKEET